jgi:hypothetical protein
MHSHLVQQRQCVVAVVVPSWPTLLYLPASQHACTDQVRQDCQTLHAAGYFKLVKLLLPVLCGPADRARLHAYQAGCGHGAAQATAGVQASSYNR